jgi:hypothetical protein
MAALASRLLRDVAAALRPASGPKSAQEVTGIDVEGSRQAEDVDQTDDALTALNRTDVCPVHAGLIRQLLE